MPYLYLTLAVFMSASSSIFGTYYNRSESGRLGGAFLYNLIMICSVFLAWAILFCFNFSFELKVLPYSLAFAIFFVLSLFGMISALNYGPTTLTSLFSSLSLLLATVWGLFFWDTKITIIVIVGLVLVAIAIVLCLFNGKKEQKKLSLKWLLFVLMVFFGNAGCSIVQRTQQTDFNGNHGVLFMVVATFIATVCALFMYLKNDKNALKIKANKVLTFPICAGICNMALNFFVILLATSPISPSLVYPVIGVGSLAIVILFSVFAFKEKLKWWQWIGMALGAIATALLSI